MKFLPLLATSLQADYFLILCNIHGSDNLDFLIPENLYVMFKKTVDILGAEVNFYSSSEPNTFILNFPDLEEQDKLVVEFSKFNHTTRQMANIPMPDVYCGRDSIDSVVCTHYLNEIGDFYTNDFNGRIGIPCRNIDDQSNPIFYIYTKDALISKQLKSDYIKPYG